MLSVLRWTLFVHGLEMNLPRIASVVRVHTWFALSSYPLLPGGRSQQCRPGLCAKFSPKVVNKAHLSPTYIFCFFCTCDLFQVLPPPWHSHRASSYTSPYLAPVLHPSHLAPTKTRHLWHCHEGRPSTTLCAMEHQLVEGTLK